LFEQAAKELFPGAQPEVFHASALPAGKNFYGIAHIHGSVEKPVERLVLTDGDFGKAYLTEGWATRFLLNVFQESTVLFVGYSQSDTVMQYLARRMPAADADSPHRFALVKYGESGVDWKLLGVTPVVFPDGGPPNPYSALERVLDGWANRCGMTVLDHVQEIERLVQQPFDLLSKEDLD
jgi:SIR2-like domain